MKTSEYREMSKEQLEKELQKLKLESVKSYGAMGVARVRDKNSRLSLVEVISLKGLEKKYALRIKIDFSYCFFWGIVILIVLFLFFQNILLKIYVFSILYILILAYIFYYEIIPAYFNKYYSMPFKR